MRRCLTLLLLLALAAPARAGTLCGLVTDQVSGAPVAQAGVFVHQGETYTGFHAATAADGTFCLDLPPGTYRLEIRVDDYLTGWRDDVVVLDGTSDVDVPLALPPVLLGAPWPNPTDGAAKMRLHVSRPAAVELSVHDARGRLVRRWATAEAAPGDLEHVWDGRDHAGRRVPGGLYLIRARSGGLISTRSVTLVD